MNGITSELYLFALKNVAGSIPPESEQGSEFSRELGKPTILVVDDQHLIADTTMAVLNLCGFRAERAYSGQDALEAALKLKPDYLLSDVVMPGMNGVDLAIAVHKQLPRTTIILISGQAGVTDLLRNANMGGYDFDLLSKPMHPEKLVEYLKRKAPHLWK